MPAIDLSILNQRQTPAFYADTLANRPAAGFVGRIFVSTNTFAFYRDNGTGWDLIGGPGSGTITGSGSFGSIALWNGTDTITYDVGLTWDGTANSLTASKFIVTGGTSSQFLKGDGSLDSNTYNTGSGAASQVAFFSGTNAITGENNLWWDSTNNHLGINTNTPATALDVNHNGTLVAKFNNTTSANTLVAFENAGNEQWWIGTENTNNDFLFYDATNFPTLSLRTTFKTNGQVLIGGGSTGSGKLVVESATSDNGIQIVGANAPSLRIDSAATGPTKRIGLGISTGVNNFIQGSVDRDMCIFNGSTTASPMLFGIYGTTNVQEAARISAARNFLIGTTTDNGSKIQINGTGYINNTFIFDGTATNQYLNFYNSGSDRAHIYWHESLNSLSLGTYVAGGNIKFETGNNVTNMFLDSSGNLGINNVTPNRKLYIQEAGTTTSGNVVAVRNSNATSGAYINFLAGGGNAPSIGAKGNDITFTADGYNGTELFRLSGTGPAQFFSSLSATSLGVGNNISGFGDIVLISNTNTNVYPKVNRSSTSYEAGWKYATGGVDNWYIGTRSSDGVNSYHFYGYNTNSSVAQFTSSGNLLIGKTTDTGAKLQVNGKVEITAPSSSTMQTVVGNKVSAASGSPTSIAYVGFSNSVRVYLYIVQDTAHGASAIADICTYYGSSNGGITTQALLGNVTGVNIIYNNSGYKLDVTVNYTGSAPTIYWTIEGLNYDANIYAL